MKYLKIKYNYVKKNKNSLYWIHIRLYKENNNFPVEY